MSDHIEYNLSCIAAMLPDRRERIATAALQGLLADPEGHATINGYVVAAVALADALIAQLDKEVKP
jgi:hypothetical protein